MEISSHWSRRWGWGGHTHQADTRVCECENLTEITELTTITKKISELQWKKKATVEVNQMVSLKFQKTTFSRKVANSSELCNLIKLMVLWNQLVHQVN